MLRLLEPAPPARRLRELLQRFRAQEQGMAAALHELQAELERCHREASELRQAESDALDALLRHCGALQAECDQLATELVHVRLAVAGTADELAACEQAAARDRLLTPA